MIPFSGYIIGGMALVMVGAAGVGYVYYKDTQSTIGILRENNANLKVSVDLLEAERNRIRENFEEQKTLITGLQKENKKAEERLDNTRKVLRNHDLTNLSLKKPGLIEKRINDGTKKIFSDIKSATAE